MSDNKDNEAGASGGTPEKDKSEKSTDEKTSPDTGGDVASGIAGFMSGLLSKLNISPKPKTVVLESKTVEDLARYMHKCRNIVVMSGAGISTSAGIPDFRSPGSGLYSSIHEKYGLMDPQSIFEIGFFRRDPKPFYMLAKELFPAKLEPTPAHCFIKLLHDKGVLLRTFTQNIDGLERQAGIPDDKIVEAHGTFYTSHCTTPSCKQEYAFDWMKEKLQTENVDVPLCTKCKGVVKPDVVFFGENLPENFFRNSTSDFPRCDLLIIMGTSLQVQPFASLINRVSDNTPRVLINREKVGDNGSNLLGELLNKLGAQEDFDLGLAKQFLGSGMDFESEQNRDIAILGDCDDGVIKLAKALGWEDELKKLRQDILSSTASEASGSKS